MSWVTIGFWIVLGFTAGFLAGAFVVASAALRREQEIIERLRWVQRQGSVVRVVEGNGDRSA